MKRLKILISAYACSPRQGSEPGVGWQFVSAISKYHDIWVLTEKEKFESDIESELDRRPDLREHMRFFYIPKVRHRTLRKIWPPSYYWFYRHWQVAAYELAQSLCKDISFDVVHQLNMNGFREPGYLWNLNLPFVWGPVGGFMQFPWRFLECAGPAGLVYHAFRNVINACHMRFLKRPRQAAARARGSVMATTTEMQRRMLQLWNVDSVVLCETGQMEKLGGELTARPEGSPLRLAWSGAHISRKGLPLLLHALSLVRHDVKWELTILGAGPQTDAWKRLSNELGIQHNCRWSGWLQHHESISVINGMHVFFITSLEDSTPLITLEALSQGVPIVCLNHCGFADVVTEDCGIQVRVDSPRQVHRDIAKAIETLWDNEEHRQRLCLGALRRAEDFSWENKMEVLNRIYADAASRKTSLEGVASDMGSQKGRLELRV